MKNLFKKIKQVSILILAISFIGCEDDDAVLPKLTAGFTHTIDADTGTVTFINTSVNASSYAWDFGDDSTSTLINPVNVYADGTYTIVLVASNVAGAIDTFTDEITISIPEIATLPITFDGENTTYNPTVFDGTSFEIVTNPDLSGTNAVESNVGAITNSGATYEGLFFELGTAVDLTSEQSIKMSFWADAPIDVLLKLEDGTAADTEDTASHTGTGWEELMFTFNSSASYPKLTLFVDGAGTTAGTFYFDDVTQVASPPTPCVAEAAESLAAADLNVTFMADPTASITDDGATFEWISNPDIENTVNTSCKVGKITKLGNNPWDNTQINLDAKLDFNANEGLKLKVWSGKANSEVRIKLEEIGNSGNFVEKFLTTTVTSGWEELSFAFTGADSNKFDKIVIFFDLNANNTDTYYFDDLTLYGTGTAPVVCDPETAESYSATNLNMTFQTDPSADFISDGAGFSWIDNPDFDNTVNSSCKVGKVVKGNTNPWDNNQYDLDAKLDFNSNSGLKIKVWSGRANTEVRLKLEEIGNPGNNFEKFLTTSVTSGWEELTFPFDAAQSDKFNKIVIFFDLNANNTDTYYFDDLKLYGSGGGGGGGGTDTCPEPPAGELLANGDFEAGDVGCWQFFDGTTISTTINNGGSQSAEIQGSTGVAVGLKMERFGTGLVTPNTSYTVKFDIIASDVLGDGGLVKAFTFSEGADGGTVAATQHILTDNTTSISTTTWETKTFTFTSAANANQVEGGISFLIEIVNSAARLNVDNISVRKTP
ncbi:PKD domain-containing protein [Flavobacteriaceae bacterium]|nr:PKD domain-containing protein [Flavobacteriaceae bacterium]MDC1471963.1 PKD domain-containing protein [Flavobacteriaceae bacterium]MDC1539615.1 PKD domain-containing protein [Flavobacteriaceae bacterium]